MDVEGKRKAEIEEFDKPSNQLACLNSDTGSYVPVDAFSRREILSDRNLIECP